jgi:hypothetical protein
MRTNTGIYEIDITKRAEEITLQIPLPNKAKRVKAVVVTTRLHGTSIQAPRHYFGSLGVGLTPVNTDLQNVTFYSPVKALQINNLVGEHIYYARPSRIPGHPAFMIDGQTVAFGNPTKVTYTDTETGYIEDYNLYESINGGYGNILLQAL